MTASTWLWPYKKLLYETELTPELVNEALVRESTHGNANANVLCSIEAMEFGSRITVTVGAPAQVVVPMICMLIVTVLIGTSMLIAPHRGPNFIALLPWGMFTLAVLVLHLDSILEAQKAERWLRELLPPYQEPPLVGPYR
jgi:hypothetical protein